MVKLSEVVPVAAEPVPVPPLVQYATAMPPPTSVAAVRTPTAVTRFLEEKIFFISVLLRVCVCVGLGRASVVRSV